MGGISIVVRKRLATAKNCSRVVMFWPCLWWSVGISRRGFRIGGRRRRGFLEDVALDFGCSWLVENVFEVARLLVGAKRGGGSRDLNLVATPGTGIGIWGGVGFDVRCCGHAGGRARRCQVNGGGKVLLDGAEIVVECLRRYSGRREVEGFIISGIGDGFIGDVDADISYVLTEVVGGHHVLLDFGVETKEFLFGDDALFVNGGFDGLCFGGDGSCRACGENQLGDMFEVVLHVCEVGFEVRFDDGKAIIRFGAVFVVGLFEGSNEIGDVVAGIGWRDMFRGDRRGRRVVDVTGDCFSVGTASG